MRHIFKISILLLFCCAAKADYTTSQAEELYRSGDWKKATEAYRELTQRALQQGNATAPLFYNYGTALAKSGSTGEAYAVLWKALFLNPMDSDIRFNLSLAADKLPDAVKGTQPATWLSWWPQAALPISYKIWLCFALIFLPVLFWPFKSESAGSLKIGAGLCFLFFLIIGTVSYYQTGSKAAGLISAVKTRSGPDQSFPEISSLDAGALVNLEELRDGWYKIRFQSAQNQETVGWIPSATVLEIN